MIAYLFYGVSPLWSFATSILKKLIRILQCSLGNIAEIGQHFIVMTNLLQIIAKYVLESYSTTNDLNLVLKP